MHTISILTQDALIVIQLVMGVRVEVILTAKHVLQPISQSQIQVSPVLPAAISVMCVPLVFNIIAHNVLRERYNSSGAH